MSRPNANIRDPATSCARRAVPRSEAVNRLPETSNTTRAKAISNPSRMLKPRRSGVCSGTPCFRIIVKPARRSWIDKGPAPQFTPGERSPDRDDESMALTGRSLASRLLRRGLKDDVRWRHNERTTPKSHGQPRPAPCSTRSGASREALDFCVISGNLRRIRCDAQSRAVTVISP